MIWQSPDIEKHRRNRISEQLLKSSRFWINVHLIMFLAVFIELNTSLLFIVSRMDGSLQGSYGLVCQSMLFMSSCMILYHLYQYYFARQHLTVKKKKIAEKEKSPNRSCSSPPIYLPSAYKHVHPGPSMFPSNTSTNSHPLDTNPSPGPLSSSPVISPGYGAPRLNVSLLTAANSGSPANFDLSLYLPRPVVEKAYSPSDTTIGWAKRDPNMSFTNSLNTSAQFGSSGSPWSPTNLFLPATVGSVSNEPDFSGLRRYQYQMASPSPQTLTSSGGRQARRKVEEQEQPADMVWNELSVTQSDIDTWIENLRKWIHGTILCRIVEEIHSTNRRLREFGSDDIQIGEASIATLRQLAGNKTLCLPNMDILISFLDCTKEQGYLVHRLQELCRGGCLGEFRWDGGSRSERWTWKEHLPNDSVIILHLFSTYMDTRLPPCIDRRAKFTQLHVLRAPDKIDLTSKSCLLYQTSIQPPHFKVVVEGTIYDLAAGRKNMFNALVFFLYQVKMRDGILRRLNFGRSGVNILWIFGDEDL